MKTAPPRRAQGYGGGESRQKSLVSQGAGVGVEEGEESAVPGGVLGREPHFAEGGAESKEGRTVGDTQGGGWGGAAGGVTEKGRM